MNKILLNVDQITQKLHISKQTLYQWTSMKKIPYIKMHRKILFDETEINQWIESKKVQTL